jgi:hypothetical protein
MSRKSKQRQKQTDQLATLGFAGRLLAGQTPHSARQELRANLLSTPGSLEILKELFKENPQYEQESRQEWASYGLEPPWEGL